MEAASGLSLDVLGGEGVGAGCSASGVLFKAGIRFVRADSIDQTSDCIPGLFRLCFADRGDIRTRGYSKARSMVIFCCHFICKVIYLHGLRIFETRERPFAFARATLDGRTMSASSCPSWLSCANFVAFTLSRVAAGLTVTACSMAVMILSGVILNCGGVSLERNVETVSL